MNRREFLQTMATRTAAATAFGLAAGCAAPEAGLPTSSRSSGTGFFFARINLGYAHKLAHSIGHNLWWRNFTFCRCG